MSISIYTVFISFIWTSVFSVLLAILCKSNKLVIHFGVWPLVLLAITSIIRCFLPVEIPSFTYSISDFGISATVDTFLNTSIGNTPISPLHFFFFLWALVAVFLFVRFFFSYSGYLKKIRSLEETSDPQILKISKNIGEKLEMPAFRIYQTLSVQSPLVFGFFHPTILLPCHSYSRAEYELIFLHEFTHWKSHDLWVKFLVEFVCYLFWWNPFVYLLRRNLNQALELKCDISIVKGRDSEERIAYLETLKSTLKLGWEQEKAAHPPCILSELFHGSAALLIQRSKVILNYCGCAKQSRAIISFSTAIVIVFFVLSYSFVIQPAYAPPLEDIEKGGSINIDPNTAHIVKTEHGVYILHTGEDALVIDEEYAKVLVEDNYPLKESATQE